MSHFVLTHYFLKDCVHLLMACIPLKQTTRVTTETATDLLPQVDVSSMADSVKPGKELFMQQSLYSFSDFVC